MMPLLLLFLTLVTRSYAGLQCLDDNNNPIDWWFMYKLPDGYRYGYKDSADSSTVSLELASNPLNRTTDGALGSTLHQVYEDKTGLAYVFYNDEPPVGSTPSSNSAHAKGVMASDGTSGFWLIHSVPKFPDLTAVDFTFPSGGEIYGQTFLCLTLPNSEINSLTTQLQYDKVSVYESNLPSGISWPNLQSLIDGNFIDGTNILNTQTIGGASFTSFAKSPSWGQDLYENLVLPQLKTGFMWETWRRRPFLDPYCPPSYSYASVNVETFILGGKTFKYTQDHSKWGAELPGGSDWVCVGDINRMGSQRARGGGTMCTVSTPLWSALTGVVATYDTC